MDIRSFQKRGKKLPVKAAADGNQFLPVPAHAKKIVRPGDLLRVIHWKCRVINNLARLLFLPLLHPEQIFHPNRSKPPRAQPVEDFAAFAGIIPLAVEPELRSFVVLAVAQHKKRRPRLPLSEQQLQKSQKKARVYASSPCTQRLFPCALKTARIVSMTNCFVCSSGSVMSSQFSSIS